MKSFTQWKDQVREDGKREYLKRWMEKQGGVFGGEVETEYNGYPQESTKVTLTYDCEL